MVLAADTARGSACTAHLRRAGREVPAARPDRQLQLGLDLDASAFVPRTIGEQARCETCHGRGVTKRGVTRSLGLIACGSCLLEHERAGEMPTGDDLHNPWSCRVCKRMPEPVDVDDTTPAAVAQEQADVITERRWQQLLARAAKTARVDEQLAARADAIYRREESDRVGTDCRRTREDELRLMRAALLLDALDHLRGGAPDPTNPGLQEHVAAMMVAGRHAQTGITMPGYKPMGRQLGIDPDTVGRHARLIQQARTQGGVLLMEPVDRIDEQGRPRVDAAGRPIRKGGRVCRAVRFAKIGRSTNDRNEWQTASDVVVAAAFGALPVRRARSLMARARRVLADVARMCGARVATARRDAAAAYDALEALSAPTLMIRQGRAPLFGQVKEPVVPTMGNRSEYVSSGFLVGRTFTSRDTNVAHRSSQAGPQCGEELIGATRSPTKTESGAEQRRKRADSVDLARQVLADRRFADLGGVEVYMVASTILHVSARWTVDHLADAVDEYRQKIGWLAGMRPPRPLSFLKKALAGHVAEVTPVQRAQVAAAAKAAAKHAEVVAAHTAPGLVVDLSAHNLMRAAQAKLAAQRAAKAEQDEARAARRTMPAVVEPADVPVATVAVPVVLAPVVSVCDNSIHSCEGDVAVYTEPWPGGTVRHYCARCASTILPTW